MHEDSEYCMVNSGLNKSRRIAANASRKANHFAGSDSQMPPKVNPEKMAVVFSDSRCTL